jgi:hypothetical protein
MTAYLRLLFPVGMLVLVASAANGSGPPIQAQCRPDLVPWNCAGLFSGSFESKSILKGGMPGGVQVYIKEDVAVVINAGRATCLGTRAGTLIVVGESETQITTSIQGPGVVAVEYGTNREDDPKGPYYKITVACPSPRGEEVNTDLRTGQKTVLKVVSRPPDGFRRGEMSSYKQPGTEQAEVLRGTTVDEHPEADVANGLTGTVTVNWKLVKDKKP